jgi:hypothetical protein
VLEWKECIMAANKIALFAKYRGRGHGGYQDHGVNRDNGGYRGRNNRSGYRGNRYGR